MHQKEHAVGAIGTIFRATLKVDIGDLSGATRMEFLVLKPDGTTTTWTAVFTTNGSDNKIEFKTVTLADLDQPGQWEIQAYAETADGKWYTPDRYQFKVVRNIFIVVPT